MFQVSNINGFPSPELASGASGAVPVIPFSPGELSSLLGWFDGYNQSSLLSDGFGNLETWIDSSPNVMNTAPIAGVNKPVLTANALAGKTLPLLTGNASFKTVKDPLPFGPGWGYNGPLVSLYAGRMIMPADFGDIPFLQIDGSGIVLTAGRFIERTVYNLEPLEIDLRSGAYGYLRANWPGPILASAETSLEFVVISVKGSVFNRAQIFFKIGSQGAIPRYFGTTNFTPFTHTLASNGARRFFFGGGGGGTLFPAEWFIALDDDFDLTKFNRVRDYALDKWLGARKNFVLCLGDSLTGGFGIGQANAYPYLLSLYDAQTDLTNVGINGRTAEMLLADWPAYHSLSRPGATNKVNLWVGTNNIYNGDNAATALTKCASLISAIQASGYTVKFFDCIPRNFGAPYAGNPQDAAKEAQRIIFNAGIGGIGANSIVRLCNSAPFNNPAAYQNGAYYNADETHLVLAGNQRVADLVNAS